MSPSNTMNPSRADLLTRARRLSVAALKANLAPGLLLQSLMVMIALGYLLHPGVRGVLEHLALMKGRLGLIFSFLGTASASAILPELLSPLLPGSRSRPAKGMAGRLLFAFPFWGLIGVQVDLFYRLQYLLFGPSDSLSVIASKVAVDALLYCPLLAIPQAVSVFLWKDHGYSFGCFRRRSFGEFYALQIFPVLMANWIVWIPVVCVIYSLPPALGIPLFIIAQSFWVMVFTTLSADRKSSPGHARPGRTEDCHFPSLGD